MKIVVKNIFNRTVCCPDGTQLTPGQQLTVEMTKANYDSCKDFKYIECREVRSAPTRSKGRKNQGKNAKGKAKGSVQQDTKVEPAPEPLGS